ncbi:MAG: phenylacetate-CoA oxygenase/reductase subunit PaaK [Ramlibacter sp.]|jgi:ring-1,2-phenylacetyl-CoA epoxidase subunit PaaE|nr:phenylacetate-CoA oxygenase/reductase subunit PaaK [Ramlibacter sp.]
MSQPRFHALTVARVSPESDGAVAVALAIPPALRETFRFQPGQFLTLRTRLHGQEVRRSYSISCPRSRLEQAGELEVGIRAVDGGVFSTWANTELAAGDTLEAMPPDGRFTVQRPRALHRVGFAAGSGITPVLSILASTLQEQPDSKFTLVYGNRRMASVMFNEALQDLKDRYPDRLTLVHVLSRQAQEVPLLEGRIDAPKVRAVIDALLPVGSMDEVFVCGPEGMIDDTTAALVEAGVPAQRVHAERFTSGDPVLIADKQALAGAAGQKDAQTGDVALTVIADGKRHALRMNANQHVLDVALAAGLDLPWSCRGGVCCTCRAKVLEGSVAMDRNFTLEPWETGKGFVLSCQARPTSQQLVVSYDER